MPLIKTIAEYRAYIPVDVNTSLGTMTPFIDEAEKLFIIDLLGQEFYDEFSALYAAAPGVALSADNLKLLPYIQRALAYYAQLQAMVHLAVTWGDMGIRQHHADESDPAPRWLQEKLQFQALRNGDLHADKLLEFLEQNATTANDYGTWFDSDANTINSGRIVYGTAVASKHIDINNSRRVFMKLRGRIREIEERIVPKLIGKEQYEELVEELKAGTPTAENMALIEKLEPIICKRALFMQLPFMRVSITENGIFVYSGTDELLKPGQLARETDIKVLRQQLMDSEEMGYLADEELLRQFILDNIADYPLISSTGVYTVQPDPGPTWEPKNDPDNKFFAV